MGNCIGYLGWLHDSVVYMYTAQEQEALKFSFAFYLDSYEPGSLVLLHKQETLQIKTIIK
jgi:hypothetical protein